VFWTEGIEVLQSPTGGQILGCLDRNVTISRANNLAMHCAAQNSVVKTTKRLTYSGNTMDRFNLTTRALLAFVIDLPPKMANQVATFISGALKKGVEFL
jgi:hypothetical protein